MSIYKTPMLQQYQKIKEQYPDCLLFFRLGDFYELFGDDAKIGSEVLHITLTARDKGGDGKIPMCGVPFHASENYVARLVNAGYKVAICEQVSEKGKGLVEREVVRVVTAGTLLRDESLTDAGSQYILSLVIEPKTIAGAAADLSTGQFMAFSFSGSPEQLIPLLVSHFNPRECIMPRVLYDNQHIISLIRREQQVNITCAHDWLIYIKDAEKLLKTHFKVDSLDTFGLTNKTLAVKAAAALLGYLRYTQKGNVEHITTIREFHLTGHLVLDPTTLRHLEVVRAAEGSVDGSLFGAINTTTTAAGQRMLQDWLLHPITNKSILTTRHDGVGELLNHTELLKQLREQMVHISDIERLVGRLSVGLGAPRDLRRLADTLWHVHDIVLPLFAQSKSARLGELSQPFEPGVRGWIIQAREHLFEEAKSTLDEGYIFKEGYNPELDALRGLTSGNQTWLRSFEEQERSRTGIPKLKVVYSRAFGYAIEVSKINKDRVPADYIPRQTLVNAERFTCQPLVDYEQKALSAMDQMIALEKQLFYKQVEQVVALSSQLSLIAERTAELDVLVSFATNAKVHRYIRPNLQDNVGITIKGGRHPVIEQIGEEAFIANDTMLTPDKSLQLITGPNMAGKSTYIRQVALLVLLAQTGSFIPASEAVIGITDRIFTRIGAHDNLRAAQSTFMVEMLETAHILHNATERSLVILDEVGRGTSPEDGFALAWAIAEALSSHTKGLVLFATHFHALKDLASQVETVFNSHLAVSVDNDDLIFLRKVVPGPTDESYGIVVAEKAGVPKYIIKRAKELALITDPAVWGVESRSVSSRLERPKADSVEKKSDPQGHPERSRRILHDYTNGQLALLSVSPSSVIEQRLREVNINKLTPLEALSLLAELQKLL
jgi:DNA mismatch repair protein MutS